MKIHVLVITRSRWDSHRATIIVIDTRFFWYNLVLVVSSDYLLHLNKQHRKGFLAMEFQEFARSSSLKKSSYEIYSQEVHLMFTKISWKVFFRRGENQWWTERSHINPGDLCFQLLDAQEMHWLTLQNKNLNDSYY